MLQKVQIGMAEVRHRIDGLETLRMPYFCPLLVRHRIDGLEKRRDG